MIKCIIIDDEKHARDGLEMMINRYFNAEIEVLGKAASVKEGIALIGKNMPNIVFLDIEMENENGFSLFNYYEQVPFSVIFVTAFKEYAIKAVKAAALDYILKPVSEKDLREAITLYERQQLAKVDEISIKKLLNGLNAAGTGKRKVKLPTFSGFELVKLNSICYCEADHNYTKVFTSDNREFLISKPLKSIEELLPVESFFRIHKSYLVNLSYVKTYGRKDGIHVILENDVKLPVAIRKNESLVRVLSQ